MTDSEKIDSILEKISLIQTSVEVHKEHRIIINDRMTKVESGMDKVKISQNRLLGAFTAISAFFTLIGSLIVALINKNT